MLHFFGTTWTKLTHELSEIAKIILACRSLITTALTISCITGLSLSELSTIGLQSSSNKILCMTIWKLIPFISVIDHAMASLFSYKTRINMVNSSSFNSELIITGKVLFSPRNTYFKFEGNGFNTNPSPDFSKSYNSSFSAIVTHIEISSVLSTHLSVIKHLVSLPMDDSEILRDFFSAKKSLSSL